MYLVTLFLQSLIIEQMTDDLVNNSCLHQLRYLQTLSSIAAENNSTIVFPVPIDLVATMLNNAASHQ